MQNSIYKIKYLLFLSLDWEAWCWNTAWNKGRKCFHCLGASNNLIRPWLTHCKMEGGGSITIWSRFGAHRFPGCVTVTGGPIDHSVCGGEGADGDRHARHLPDRWTATWPSWLDEASVPSEEAIVTQSDVFPGQKDWVNPRTSGRDLRERRFEGRAFQIQSKSTNQITQPFGNPLRELSVLRFGGNDAV